LPSVTLGKGFAECKIAFAVCLEHTAKKLIPVVFREVQPTKHVISYVLLCMLNTKMKNITN
jgi:hypothetical protein